MTALDRGGDGGSPMGGSAAGYTRLVPHALRKALQAAAAEEFGAAPGDVRVRLSDAGDELRLIVPLRLPGLLRTPPGGEDVWARCERARAALRTRAQHLAGLRLRRIDIEIGRVTVENTKVTAETTMTNGEKSNEVRDG